MANATCPAFTLFNFLLSSFVSKVSHEANDTDLTAHRGISFDFIVVGAGSAGSVIANRLSENPEWNILVLEAGCNEVLFENSPVMYLASIDRHCIWTYTTVPHPHVNRGLPVLIETGKTLGGSSSINGLFYVRGNKKDYDQWAAKGNVGWDYESVLPYFKKAENMTNPDLARSRYHATGGPLSVSVFDYESDDVVQGVKKAFQETLNLPQIDYNGETQIGSGFLQFTIQDGERHSTNRAYLKPVRHRRNLIVKTYSRATKIIIDPVTRKATGVEFVNKNGLKESVFASKEVIVCAGAINSPQLLMLSGVGPRDHLKSHGIKVIQDLPVGKNFQDHVAIIPTFPILIGVRRNANPLYRRTSSGQPFRTSQFMTAFKSFRSGDPAWPDVQYSISKIVDLDGCLRPSRNSLLDSVFIFPSLLHPKSVGEVSLADANPFSKPKVDPRYLSKHEDVQVLKDALKFLLRLNNSTALTEAGLRFKGVPPSLCCLKGKNCIDGDKFWDCVVRRHSSTSFHPYGSCKMGPESDDEAVVDPQLRVRGLLNLRVVDASVLTTISGNLNAPIIMMGEKASAMIKNHWQRSKNNGRNV